MGPLTRSCFLLLPLERFFLLVFPFLLGTFLPSLQSIPFPLQAPALILLSLAKVQLFLTLSDLTIWWSGQTVSFGILANCSLCGTEVTLSFSTCHYDLVFTLKPTPFCKVSAGLGSTNKSAASFLVTDSSSVLATLFSALPFRLLQSF